MGWKGTLRTVRAEVRRAEKRQMQYQKLQMIAQAEDLVEKQNQYVDKLRSFHKRATQSVNWKEVSQTPAPLEPQKSSRKEDEARKKFENYQPNFLIKLLKLENWRKESLQERIELAVIEDKNEYVSLMRSFHLNFASWKSQTERAERILNKDILAYEEVLLAKDILNGDALYCQTVSMSFVNGTLEVEVDAFGEDIIPSEIYSVLKSGKISEKSMPKTQFNQLYQDYICSLCLATARVFTDLFPEDKLVVSVMADVLNPSSGYTERQALLSAFIPKSTLQTMNMDAVDPSEAMRRFNHNMVFKNTTGLSPIAKVGAA